MPELLNDTAMVTQKDGLRSEIYRGAFGSTSPKAASIPTRALWSLTIGHCGKGCGLPLLTAVLPETTESPAQQRGNEQGLELRRALPSDEPRIIFCKLLAGCISLSSSDGLLSGK